MQLKNSKTIELETIFQFKPEKYNSIESYLIDRQGFWYNQYQKCKQAGQYFDRSLWQHELEIVCRKFEQVEEIETLTALADRMATEAMNNGKAPLAPSAKYFSVRYRSFPSLGTYKAFRDDIADLIERLGSIEKIIEEVRK